MKVAQQALGVESYLFTLWSNPNTFLPDKMYHQANPLSRFPCSGTHTRLRFPPGPPQQAGQALPQRGILPAKESTTVLQPCLKPNEGLKWDLSALIFLSKSVKPELATPSFLFLINLPPRFPRSPWDHLSPAVCCLQERLKKRSSKGEAHPFVRGLGSWTLFYAILKSQGRNRRCLGLFGVLILGPPPWQPERWAKSTITQKLFCIEEPFLPQSWYYPSYDRSFTLTSRVCAQSLECANLKKPCSCATLTWHLFFALTGIIWWQWNIQ